MRGVDCKRVGMALEELREICLKYRSCTHYIAHRRKDDKWVIRFNYIRGEDGRTVFFAGRNLMHVLNKALIFLNEHVEKHGETFDVPIEDEVVTSNVEI